MATKSQFSKPGREVRSDGVFSKLLSRKRATKLVKTFKKLKYRFFLSLLSKDSEICWLRWPSRSELCFVSIDSYYFQQAIAIELLLTFQECEDNASKHASCVRFVRPSCGLRFGPGGLYGNFEKQFRLVFCLNRQNKRPLIEVGWPM